MGTVRDLAEGLSRPTFRDSLATELGLTPRALRVLLPYRADTVDRGLLAPL